MGKVSDCILNFTFIPPTAGEIVKILREHNPIRVREKITRVFLVGSFTMRLLNASEPGVADDMDILLEIQPKTNANNVRQRPENSG
jgi:predicted nucleotidyltransferase